MVMLLIKMRLLPLLRSYLNITLALVLISMLAFSLVVGISGAYTALLGAVDGYIDEYNYPDIRLTTALGCGDTDKISLIDGVTDVRSRMQLDAPVKLDERYLTARLFSYDTDNKTDFYFREGNFTGGVFVEYHFARNNNMHTGDKLQIGENTAVIAALVSAPECISIYQNSYIWGDQSDFGYIYVPRTTLLEWFPMAADNQVLIYAENDEQQSRILDEAQALLAPSVITESFVFEDSPVNKSVTINTKPLYAISLLLPPIFFAVMLITVALFLIQIVRQQKRQFGIYLALGYHGSQIIVLLCTYTLVITIAGSAAGFLLSKLLMRIICGLYADTFSMPHFSAHADLNISLLATALTVAVGQIATLICTRSCLRVQPVVMIRGQENYTGEPHFLIRTVFKRLSELPKIAVSTALRHGGRFVLNTVCITFSAVLIITAFSFYESKNAIFDQLFEKRIRYDCQLFSLSSMDNDFLDRVDDIEGVTDVSPMIYTSVEINVGDDIESIVLCGLPEEAMAVRDVTGEPYNLSDDGFILESHIAEKYGLEIGDSVDINGHSCIIEGLSNQYVNRINYGSLSFVAEVTDISAPNCATLSIDKCSENKLLEMLYNTDGGTSAVFTRLLSDSTKQEFKTYDIGVGVITLFALLMALVITYNMSIISLRERKTEFGTMLTLGYTPRHISDILLMETLFKLLLSLMLACPAGSFTAKFILSQMSTSRREYPFTGTWVLYAAAAAMMIGFTLISHFICVVKVKNIDITESVKYID